MKYLLKDYCSRKAEQNVIKFAMKYHREKGNQFYIKNGGCLQGTRGTWPYKGNKGKYLKDYFSGTAEKNVTKFDLKHHLMEQIVYKRR